MTNGQNINESYFLTSITKTICNVGIKQTHRQIYKTNKQKEIKNTNSDACIFINNILIILNRNLRILQKTNY